MSAITHNQPPQYFSQYPYRFAAFSQAHLCPLSRMCVPIVISREHALERKVRLAPRVHGGVVTLVIAVPTPTAHEHGLLQSLLDVLRPLRHGAFLYYYCVHLTTKDGLNHLQDVGICGTQLLLGLLATHHYERSKSTRTHAQNFVRQPHADAATCSEDYDSFGNEVPMGRRPVYRTEFGAR
jgi:hypothetical protein